MTRCLVLIGMLLFAGCDDNGTVRLAEDSRRTTLVVAAASNLQFVFDEIEHEFETQFPAIDLRLTYGSSANLHSQITQQAPFDLFFSADTRYPESLIALGLANQSDCFIYAQGTLVLFASSRDSFDFQSVGWDGLLNPAIRKIAIANPKLAPYGQAAEQTLRELGLYDRVSDKLVFGESVTQTAQFVASGSADVGLLAGSLAFALADEGVSWPVPQSLYEPIHQAAIICANCSDRDAASKLRQFVLGPAGVKILSSNGYTFPDLEASLPASIKEQD